MSRLLHTRLILSGELEAKTPIHIGGAEEGIEIDMPLAENGEGSYYIPGTSLAGTIRAWCVRVLSVEMKGFQDRMWGNLDDGASLFILEDSVPKLPDDVTPEIWHGIAIDRYSGTAVPRMKFDKQVLPAGTGFPLTIKLDVIQEKDLELARALLWLIRNAFEKGQIPIGSGSTRGLGNVYLRKDSFCREEDWGSRVGILNILKQRVPAEASEYISPDITGKWEDSAKSCLPSFTPNLLRFDIQWKPLGPLMSKSPEEGLDVDILPLMSAKGPGSTRHLVLPGSSIKGVFRSHCERILRTLLQPDNPENDQSPMESTPEKHNQNINLPLIRELFGIARSDKKDDERNGQNNGQGMKGALHVLSCYSKSSFEKNHDFSQSQINATDKLQKAFHNAVDRWTGGAAEGFLYSACEPFDFNWEPLSLTLDVDFFRKRSEDISPLVPFALIWLLIRDLTAGYIPIGFGFNRGYGHIEVERLEIHGIGSLLQSESADPITIEVKKNVAGTRMPDSLQLKDLLEMAEKEWSIWIERTLLESPSQPGAEVLR